MLKKWRENKYNDELPGRQYEELEHIMFRAQGIKIPKGCDEVANGTGVFGGLTNPIPVNGILGEFMYLSRLRSIRNGLSYAFHRPGSYTSEITRSPVDIFELMSLDGIEWHQICICPYYPRRSRRSPDYAQLFPWKQMDEPTKTMSRFGFGTNRFVENFPFGLPKVMREANQENYVVDKIATRFEKILDELVVDVEKTKEATTGEDMSYLVEAMLGGKMDSITIGGQTYSIKLEELKK